MILLSSADFFLSYFQKKFQEYHQNDKQFGPRSGPTYVGLDLDLNCLQLTTKVAMSWKEFSYNIKDSKNAMDIFRWQNDLAPEDINCIFFSAHN